jgi:AcrR family transcriptional regulator
MPETAPIAAPAERGNASGRATRQLLLTTAEKLFAERGIDAVSLREIGQAAGQRNNAATGYHFGNKEGLILAVVEFRRTETNHGRAKAVRALDASGRSGDLVAVVDAFIRPFVDVAERAGSNYIGFLARLQVERGGGYVASSVGAPHSEAYHRIHHLMAACLPDVPPRVLRHRMTLASTWVIHALARMASAQQAGERRLNGVGRKEFVADLVGMVAAMVAAPWPPPQTH